MAFIHRDRKEALEAGAVAFLSKVETPGASSRLTDYGPERVWARAEKQREAKAPAAARRAYRNPALLRRALVISLVVLMVMLVSSTGAYAFSYNAQPDSVLYGTKIFFERARITLTPSSAEDIRLEMSYSERRMEELQKMVASGSQWGADRWLREYRRNIEGAGVLFETISPLESEELSTQFQEMLDRQAHMMQGMGQGQPSGLTEPIDHAYQVCDQERMRMRERCGQENRGNPEQEPGGQQQNGNRPASHESSTVQEGPSTPVETQTSYDAPAAESPYSAPSGDTSPAPDDTQENGSAMAEEGARQQDAGYQGGGMHRGCVP
jgi:hypothetical protein